MTVVSEKEYKRIQKIRKSKIKALKKIESILKKSLANTAKEINDVLKAADVWYCEDDLIKDHKSMHEPNDRNGDQFILDFAAAFTNGSELNEDDTKKLWTEEEIEA